MARLSQGQGERAACQEMLGILVGVDKTAKDLLTAHVNLWDVINSADVSAQTKAVLSPSFEEFAAGLRQVNSGSSKLKEQLAGFTG